MSIIGMGLFLGGINKMSKDSGGLADLLEGLMNGAESIGNAYNKVKNGIEQKAEQKANKIKFNEILETYKKLSQGKEPGTVETFKSNDGSTVATFIHTQNGPFVKVERAKRQTDGSILTSVSYNGFRKIKDEKGNDVLTYIKDVSKGKSIGYDYAWRDYFISYHTSGRVLTETGLESNLGHHKDHRDLAYDYKKEGGVEFKNAPLMPTDGTFQAVGEIEKEFEKMLEEAQKRAENNKGSTL